jgi:hypothetical protein
MLTHKHYQDLCTVAASGAASDSEFEDLVDHLQDCVECRALFRDCIKVVADVLPEIASSYRPTETTPAAHHGSRSQTYRSVNTTMPHTKAGSRIRMLRNQPWKPIPLTILTALIAFVFFGFLLLTVYRRAPTVRSVEQGKPAETVANRPATESQPGPAKPADQVRQLIEELQNARKRIAEVEPKIKIDEHALEAIGEEKIELQTRLTADDMTIADLREDLRERQVRLGELEQRLAEQETQLRAKEGELNTMSTRLSTTAAQLNHQRELSAAFDQLQMLLAARNLHFTDVHDDDPSGNGPFGRVLYAKGQSLMMYAYSLSNASQRADAITYYVWGKKGGSGQAIRSLGVLRNDDVHQGRWHLTLDDPTVLSQIDSIFVTAESGKTAKGKPTGQPILAANLSGSANHP